VLHIIARLEIANINCFWVLGTLKVPDFKPSQDDTGEADYGPISAKDLSL
jgi:hypothetical protein